AGQPDVGGDRAEIKPGDRVVLIVEHDPKFANILLDVAHEQGFKALITTTGESVLPLAHKYKPEAITLDVRLPDMDGLVVLDRLKRDPRTRHVPVHVITVDEALQQGTRLGAFACLQKPVAKKALDEAFASLRQFVDRRVKNLLVVEDNDVERMNVLSLIGNGD